ncbi:hypothetical protein R80B4_02810 [Fibrobacteres bacterium R8-0-B4]
MKVSVAAGKSEQGSVSEKTEQPEDGYNLEDNNADALPAEADGSENPEQFTDGRDGQKYKTAKIGPQTWMAANLNYQTESGSWCYGDDKSNCDKYGRLYDWNTAKTACPKGWKLPSRQDWGDLVSACGGDAQNKCLKSKTGWAGRGANGWDNYGFSALPGGGRGTDGAFYNVGEYGNWWTATEDEGGIAYGLNMGGDNDDVDDKRKLGKSFGGSVRCLKE